MNRFIRLVKENVIPSIIFTIIVVSCVTAWYTLHPASPYHSRYSFVVAYDAIGTLSPGNRVEVRGISKGEITKVELTEDAVYVTARVLADTKIPVNSEFRLINSGLMGEREMCVLTGDSPIMVNDGDTLSGHYDEGTSGVVKSLLAALDDLDEVLDTLYAFADSVTEGSTGKRIQRIIKKGDRLIKVGKADIKSWIGEASQLFDQLGGALDKFKPMLNSAVEQGKLRVDDAQGLISRAEVLLKRLDGLKDQSKNLFDDLSKQDNTAALILADESKFLKEVDKIILDASNLVADVKKQGIRVNIDFDFFRK